MNTRTTLATLVLAAGLLSGCDDRKNPPPANTNPPPANTNTPPKADNTDRNKVDREPDSKTPLDQGNSAADTKITAEIRRAIMDDKSMSTNAQNCKVITNGGAVVLRGPVDSEAEKASIESKARAVSGVTSVQNLLEVKIKEPPK